MTIFLLFKSCILIIVLAKLGTRKNFSWNWEGWFILVWSSSRGGYLGGVVCLQDINSPLWGWAEDRVEIFVKVHCGTVLGDAFSTWRQIRMKAWTRRKKWSYMNDVPGAELLKPPKYWVVSVMKRWLACREAKPSGKRKRLNKRWKSVIDRATSYVTIKHFLGMMFVIA